MDQSNTRSETGATSSPANSQPVIQPKPARNSRPPDERFKAPKQNDAPKNDGSDGTQGSDEGSEPKRLSLAELFSQSDDGMIRENDSADDSSDDTPPDSIDAAIKRLGLKDPKEFYSIKVPMPNGAEPVTIGELKDRVGELVDLETREMQFEQRRIAREGELLRAQTEMRELMGLIPKDKLTPALVENMRKRHDATQRRERELTLEHIPEWQNETKRLEDITGIVAMFGEYGFDESFINTLVDHRALKFVRDTYLMRERIKKALAKVTVPQKKGGQRPSGKANKGAVKPNNSEPSARRNVAPDQRTRLAELFNKSE